MVLLRFLVFLVTRIQYQLFLASVVTDDRSLGEMTCFYLS